MPNLIKVKFFLFLLFVSLVVVVSGQVEIDSIVKITNIETSYPSWSPDATHLVFQSNRSDDDSEIYLMKASGKEAKRLTFMPGADEYPVISPDNRYIAWTHTENQIQDLYLMHFDGSNQQNLTKGSGKNIHPQFSPNGKSLLFNSNRDGNFDIFLLDLHTQKLTKIISSNRPDTYAHWSPDGQHIVFVRWMPMKDQKSQGDLFTYNLQNKQEIRLTSHAAFDGWPSWSDDGGRIIFSSNRNGKYFQLFSMLRDGSQLQQLTFGQEEKASFTKPVYSRDGSNRVACTRTKDGNVEIFILQLSQKE